MTVVCERLGGRVDDVFTFPVQIHVTDVNDNAPRFVSGPYLVNISEAVPVGSVLVEVMAVDSDQQGPFSMVEYSVLPGPFASFVSFENALDGKIILVKKLDYETDTVMNIGIKAQDKGSPPMFSETNVTIHVTDADDRNPAFLHNSYTSVLPTSKGTRLDISPEPMKAVDQDFGLNSPVFYSFSGWGPIYNYLELNTKSGTV